MGWLSKLKKALNIAEAIAPMLPIPDKVKAGIAKGGDVERKVEEIVHPKPAA